MNSDFDKKINELNKIIKTGNIEDAEKEALLLYKENKESILLLNILGNIYNGKKEPEKAIKYLEGAREIFPNDENLNNFIKNLDFEEQLYYNKISTGVIVNNKNIVNNNLDNLTGFVLIDKDIEKLNDNIKTGNIENAEKEALLLYKENKESIILLNILGNIYNGKKEPQKAIIYLEEANKITGGKDINILFNLGVSYTNIDKEKAKKYLEEAKKINPNDKNIDNFIKTLNATTQTKSNNTLVLNGMDSKKIDEINKMMQTGNIEDAEKEALLLYKENKESIILLNMLGNIYNNKKEPQKAIKYLEEANNISKGKDGYILFNLGVSYSNLDKVKSKKYLEEAKKILPNDENLDDFIIKSMKLLKSK